MSSLRRILIFRNQIRSFCTQKHINSLPTTLIHKKLEMNKTNCDGSRLPIPLSNLSSKSNQKIKIQLDRSNNPTEIIAIIQQNQHKIINASIFGKAMQKCKKLKSFDSVHQIFEFMLASNVKLSVIEFTIYIDAMSNNPTRCKHVLQTMINEYNIIPNNITFGAVIKSFISTAQYMEAEHFWQEMITKYALTPNESAYTSMMNVYAQSHQNEKADLLMNEYLDKHRQGQLAYCHIFGSYIGVYAKMGNVDGMKKAIDIGTKYGMEMKPHLFGHIISCYYKARNYKKCINVFEKWMNKGNKPKNIDFYWKCAALSGMIKDYDVSFVEKEKLYFEIVDILQNQLKNFDLRMDSLLAKTQLSAAIFLYGNVNPFEIVNVFEQLLLDGLIGYVPSDGQIGCIDLHCFEPWIAQFVIRYVFGYKLKETIDKCGELVIITGIGRHGKGESGGTLKTFILNELAKWNPAIVLEQDDENNGILKCRKEQLLSYLLSDDNDNYARQKLAVPSNEWWSYQETN